MRKTRENLRVLKVFGLLLFFIAGIALADSPITLNAIFSTQHQTKTGEIGKIEIENLEVSKLGLVLEKVKPIQNAFTPENPPHVVLYLSKRRSEKEQREIHETALQQLKKAYPGIDIEIETRYLDQEETPEQQAKRIIESVAGAAIEMPPGLQTEEAKKALIQAAQTALIETKVFKNHLKSHEQPSRAENWVEGISRVKAFVGGLERAAQIGLTGAPSDPFGLSSAIILVASDAALNYFGTKYETQIDSLLSDYSPLARKLGFNKIAELYAKSEVLRIASGTALSLAVFSIGVPAAFQTIAHFVNPVNELPTLSDVATWAKLGAAGSLLYMGGFRYLKHLRKNERISQSFMDLSIRMTGMLYQLSSVLNSSSNETLKSWLPYVLGPYYAITASPMLIAPWLSPKTNRISLVDPLITHKEHLALLEGIGSHLKTNLEGNGLEVAVSHLSQNKKLKPGILRRLASTVGAIGTFANKGCQALLETLKASEDRFRKVQ